MKVIHLSHTDGEAGAGRAAYRIHKSLCGLGIDSRMLVSQKYTSDPTVLSMSGYGIGRWRARISEYLEARTGRAMARDVSVFLSPSRFSYFRPDRAAAVLDADLVCAYWINGAYIDPVGLAGISKPLVWRLSDVWPFTGGCHYPGSCDRFERECGDCPLLLQPLPDDLTHRLWQRKWKSWQRLDLTVVAPSRWIADLARRSSLFADRRIEVIPTGVDIDHFRPGDRAAARVRWGLPHDRLLIMFGALNQEDNLRKGYRELLTALDVVARTTLASQVLAVVFGSDVPLPSDLPVQAVSLGRLHGNEALAAAYNCADLMVVPSLEDNLPNVALEALACGAPIVAFDVCGMPDIVVDGWNGRLVRAKKPEEFGKALVELLTDREKLLTMRSNSRLYAEKYFSMKQQTLAYLRLYRQLVQSVREP